MESVRLYRKASAGKEVFDDQVIVSSDGGLANAFVYIRTGLEGKKFETPVDEAVLDQHGCMFGPRVMGVMTRQAVIVADAEEQRLMERRDGTQRPGREAEIRACGGDDPVKCNVHAWMRSYIGVLDHPYFAVTGTDGSFTLRNVPPGSYTSGVWHEKLAARS